MTFVESLRALRIAAGVELASLAILVINLLTVHWRPVSSLIGPMHGCVYLAVIILTFLWSQATTRIRATAVIPGIGGLLVLRQLNRLRQADSLSDAADS